jgi:tRNA(fMet)-specific endonuclease VapC
MPGTGKLLLDTSVVVAHLRGVVAVTERMAEAEALYLPLIALGELHFGLLRSSRPDRNLRALQSWLQAVTLLTLSESTTAEYGRIKDALARAGTPIPENDIWIAAMAREHDLTFATRDDHFALISDLTVVDWR